MNPGIVQVEINMYFIHKRSPGIPSMRLCRGSYLVFLSATMITLSRTISMAPPSFELLEYGNGPCEPVQ